MPAEAAAKRLGCERHDTSPLGAVPGRARLVVLSGDNQGQVYQLHLRCLLGCSEEAEFRFSMPLVSRRHAVIDFGDGEGWIIEDLGSANGTSVDEEPGAQDLAETASSLRQVASSIPLVILR